ncbi:MAG: phosphoribosyltransferase [Rhizomicrobium sp.]
MIFHDRADGGRQLAVALQGYRNESCVVYALPRGGVPVAAEVAQALHAPLDLILVRKIGVPFQPELAMGAVVDGGSPVTVRNENVIAMAGISESTFQQVCRRELAEVERRRTLYLGNRAPISPEGRVAIVVDDGIATGASMSAALRAMRARKPKKLVLATPVAPKDTIAELRKEADEIVCLEIPEYFDAVGYFYRNFAQTTDAEVIEALKHCGSPK